MSHDSQVPIEEPRSSDESEKPASGRKKDSSRGRCDPLLEAQRRIDGTRECARVIGRWMARYGALPGEFTDAAVDNFYLVLAQCTQPEALERAFIAAQGLASDPQTGRCFRPVPGEVLVAYRNELSRLPSRSSHDEECKACRGSGWKIIKRTDGGEGTWAVRCDGKAAA